MADSPSDAPKFMDVSKPGSSLPSSSSRPTIAGHRTLMKDPMVNQQEDKTDEVQPPEVSNQMPGTHLKLEPSSSFVNTINTANQSTANPDAANPAPTTTDQVSESAANTAAPNSSVAEKVTEAVPSGATDSINADDETTRNTDEADVDLAVKNSIDDEKKKHISQLLADHTYFVKIGDNHHTSVDLKKVGVVALGVVVLLLLLGYLSR